MIRRVLVVLFSAGWIVPLWAAGTTLIQALDPNANIISFPAFEFAATMFTVTCIWLAGVVMAWAWVLSGRKEA